MKGVREQTMVLTLAAFELFYKYFQEDDEQVESSAIMSIIHCPYNLIGIRPIRSSFGMSSALFL